MDAPQAIAKIAVANRLIVYTSSPAAVEHSNDASSYGIDGTERSSCDDSMRHRQHDRWYVRDERREQAHVGSLGALKR